jgi:accessory gene regulator protein AgrB
MIFQSYFNNVTIAGELVGLSNEVSFTWEGSNHFGGVVASGIRMYALSLVMFLLVVPPSCCTIQINRILLFSLALFTIKLMGFFKDRQVEQLGYPMHAAYKETYKS